MFKPQPKFTMSSQLLKIQPSHGLMDQFPFILERFKKTSRKGVLTNHLCEAMKYMRETNIPSIGWDLL